MLWNKVTVDLVKKLDLVKLPGQKLYDQLSLCPFIFEEGGSNLPLHSVQKLEGRGIGIVATHATQLAKISFEIILGDLGCDQMINAIVVIEVPVQLHGASESNQSTGLEPDPRVIEVKFFEVADTVFQCFHLVSHMYA